MCEIKGLARRAILLANSRNKKYTVQILSHSFKKDVPYSQRSEAGRIGCACAHVGGARISVRMSWTPAQRRHDVRARERTHGPANRARHGGSCYEAFARARRESK